MGNAYINNALHATNCITRFKTWAAENPDKYCDCELGKIKARIAELEAERDAALAVVRQLRGTLFLIKAEPYGCPMCDSGKLRNPEKEHWIGCGFARIDNALAAAARVLGETK